MRLCALALLTAAFASAACDRPQADGVTLHEGEKRVVDAYVRLTVLEVLHRDHPDSVESLLARGVVHVDTAAVRQAADSLSSEPLRWEYVFDAITKRLTELEQEPDDWWSVVQGDSSGIAESGAASNDAPRP